MSVSQISKNYILAVDDTPDNLFLIQLALEKEGHKLVLAHDGLTALAQIEHYPPELVILDVMMPGMSGYEVTEKIRQNPNLPFIPILLITAHQQSSVVEGLDLGADEFIRKPVKIDELQARVRSLLRLKHSIDARENFISCLTHDLRTPLVAVDRMLELIQKGIYGDIPTNMHRAISSIISSNHNLLQMLNNLLEVHCYETGQKVLSFINFDLQELLKEVVEELNPLAQERDLTIQLNLPEEQLEISGDRLEMRRVFTNLISNGLKFTDEGCVQVIVKKLPQKITIAVKDTGIGITSEDQESIFERFRQGAHKRSGHGLGLHLCQQIIETHQGNITVESQLSEGTTFTVDLPLLATPQDSSESNLAN
ncbi:MAG: hybrid sensor histidine kinase/response regulator [Spirulinaceae cyanobacterium]